MEGKRQTEYGFIPKNWKIVKAGDYYTNITDGTHDSPKRKAEGRFLITSKHIKRREIDFTDAYKISIEDFNKINERSHVEQWDVLISMIGAYCGFTYIERNEEVNYAVKNVGIFRTTSKLNALWLHYFLNSSLGTNILNFNKRGSSQPYISLGALRNLPILVAPLPEQRAIASVLSSLDDKIDLLHRQNKTLEAMAETLFREWFVELPEEDWEDKTLGDVIVTTSGGTPSRKNMGFYENGTINWVKSKELNGSFIFETESPLRKVFFRKDDIFSINTIH